VAHEVRNPLSAVKIALQTLERHGSLAPNDRRRVAIANREVSVIEVLLTEVMEFARPPSLEMVPVDPRTPVLEALESVEDEWSGRGVAFASRLGERMPPMRLDPTRVRTAARILLRHGAIAADEIGGGLVEIALTALPGGGIELRVSDPGHPLAPDLRARAFEPFTVTRARGTGLGLPIVLRIAREHGGTAELRERPGGGNVVTVTFSGD
jgi:signal transduction histidine kinase